MSSINIQAGPPPAPGQEMTDEERRRVLAEQLGAAPPSAVAAQVAPQVAATQTPITPNADPQPGQDPSLGYGMDVAMARAAEPTATPYNPATAAPTAPGTTGDPAAQVRYGDDLAAAAIADQASGGAGTIGDAAAATGAPIGSQAPGMGGGVGGGVFSGSNTLANLLNRRMQVAGQNVGNVLGQEAAGYQGVLDRVQGRDTVTAGDAAVLGPEQAAMRARQQELMDALQGTAIGGQMDPLTQEMLRESRSRNIADAASMAASARGRVNPALLARGQAQQVATANQQAQRDAFLAGLQQQQAARELLGSTAMGARAADIQAGAFDADARNRMALENALMTIGQDQYRDSAATGLIGLTGDVGMRRFGVDRTLAGDEWARQRALADEDIRRRGIEAGLAINAANIQAQQQLADDNRKWQILSSLLGAAGTAAGGYLAGPAGAAAGAGGASGVGGSILTSAPTLASDERQKENVADADSDVDAFLGALKAHSYDYKDTSVRGTAPGRRFGVMAQDVAKSDMGRSFLHEDGDGLMLDPVQGFGPVLASLGRLQKRHDELEAKLAKMRKRKGDN